MSTSDVARRVRAAFVPPPSVLRRGSDRLEVAARCVLLLLGLLLVPVALGVGGEVTTELESRIALQQAERHRVSAEVLSPPRAGTTPSTARTPSTATCGLPSAGPRPTGRRASPRCGWHPGRARGTRGRRGSTVPSARRPPR